MADVIEEAQRLYLDALNASGNQRRQIDEDLRFSDPADPQQWDETLKRQRESDPGGARPCLVFDQCGQYVANVAGQIEQRPPSMHALPVDSGADKKVAENLDGFYRHLEHTSRAQQHYARALTSAARCGVGYVTLRPTFINRALRWQEPRIGSEGDPLRVVFDPWSVELDGSDASFGFVLTPLSHREFEDEFGKDCEKVSFGAEDRRYARDERESVVVAEMWRAERRNVRMFVCLTAEGDEVALDEADRKLAFERGQPLQDLHNYTDVQRVVKWARMSGAELLTKGEDGLAKETEYPASGIGIIPVYGYVGWSGGRMTYCGIPRRAMQAQRSYNYHMSELHAYMATAPKAPWVASIRAIRGLESTWDRASVDTRAYLPFNDVDETGPIQAPQRASVSTNLQNHMAGAERALQDIQASIGMYQANLGAPSNETSGVAIDSRKQQGEASTAHFPAHLAASIAQIGKLCMEMIPRLMDTKRQLRVLGIDGAIGNVTIDPKQAEAVQETPQGLIINPNVGTYDVRVAVGASFATQRTQAQQAFTEMMRANPAMTPAIAPLWAQTLDVPHADKLAQVMTAVAPPEVKAILQPEGAGQETTADLHAKINQLSQALQAAIEEAHAAQRDADEAHSEAMEAKSAQDAKEDEVSIRAFDALTKRLQVLGATITPEQVQALVQQTIAQSMAQPDPAEEPAEPMEAEVMPEQPEAAEPDEDQAQPMMEEFQRLAQGQDQIIEAVTMLAELIAKPRVRIPVRDKDGNIVRVMDQHADQPTIQ